MEVTESRAMCGGFKNKMWNKCEIAETQEGMQRMFKNRRVSHTAGRSYYLHSVSVNESEGVPRNRHLIVRNMPKTESMSAIMPLTQPNRTM